MKMKRNIYNLIANEKIGQLFIFRDSDDDSIHEDSADDIRYDFLAQIQLNLE